MPERACFSARPVAGHIVGQPVGVRPDAEIGVAGHQGNGRRPPLGPVARLGDCVPPRPGDDGGEAKEGEGMDWMSSKHSILPGKSPVSRRADAPLSRRPGRRGGSNSLDGGHSRSKWPVKIGRCPIAVVIELNGRNSRPVAVTAGIRHGARRGVTSKNVLFNSRSHPKRTNELRIRWTSRAIRFWAGDWTPGKSSAILKESVLSSRMGPSRHRTPAAPGWRERGFASPGDVDVVLTGQSLSGSMAVTIDRRLSGRPAGSKAGELGGWTREHDGCMQSESRRPGRVLDEPL